MDNKKKLTVVLAVLAVVCVFAVLVFSGVIDFSKTGGEESSTDDNLSLSISNTDLKNEVKASDTADLPYLTTDIDNVFYTMSTDGEVKFYRLENNAFTQIDASGTYTTSVTLSEQDISAEITYIKEDGKICGYGLYTGTVGAYNLYQYAFFRLRNYGADYESAYSTSCLLLIDTTEDDFYSNDKVYEESFIFKYEDSTSSRSLSEASRTIGINGAKRNDYFVISDKAVDGSVEHQLFLSGRYYSEDDTTVDLFRSGGSGNNTDNVRLANDVLGNWAEYSEDGIMYITVDDNGDVVIECLDESSGDTSEVKTFKDVKRDDILVYGDYIYVISQNLLYDIDNDTETEIKYSDGTFTADMIAVEDDTVLLRGYVNNSTPVMLTASVKSGDVLTSYSDSLFRNIVNPVVLDGGNILVTAEDNGKFTYYIF